MDQPQDLQGLVPEELGRLEARVAELERANQELRRIAESYRLLFENAGDAIVVADDDARLLDVNHQAEQLTGYTRDELLHKRLVDLTTDSGVPRGWAWFQELKQRGTLTGEYRILRKDGSLREVEFTATRVAPGRYHGILRDSTDRRRAQEALRESEERFRHLIEGVKDYAVFMLDPQGRVASWNSGAERVTGYKVEEILAQHLSRFYPPEEIERGLPARLLERAAAEGRVEDEGWRLRKDGVRFWANTVITALRDEAGRLRGFVRVTRDFTEHHELEQRLRQVLKMEAVGRLAGGVAHDFNNLLTIILGFSDMALTKMSSDQPARPLVHEIKKAGERAALLTSQLLAFSRQQVMIPTVLDLNACVQDMQKMLRRLIGEDVELATVLQPNLGHVKADPSQIQQVIMNLAVNARDAMPRGGKLTIQTANVTLDVDYTRLRPEVGRGRYVMLAVSDNGLGMDEETKARLFEPFYTNKEQGKGTGLGLAMVYGIVKQSGGFIYVYSEPNLGTSFKIYLPRTEDDYQGDQSSVSRLKTPFGKETVLVVEDESGVRTLVSQVLRTCGYTVLEASRGTDALRIWENHHGPIHLLVTDVVMPGMGGPELAGRLTALRPDLKVLYLSGYTDDAVVRHGVLRAEMDFLQKPFSPVVLARKVREVLDK
jgi:PAS domain S-box-containing protein